MPGFKLSKIATKTGVVQAYEPILISVALTPQQTALVGGATGHYPSKIELTARELRVVLGPGFGANKIGF
jgi:hypothetical protein